MPHRIFIAINLPESIKKQLSSYQAKWPELPVKWTKKDNIHITLVFIGYTSDQDLVEICKTTKEVALRHNPFSINFKRICYGPLDPPARRLEPSGLPSAFELPKASRAGRPGEVGREPSGDWRAGKKPPRMIWAEGACPELAEGKKIDKLSYLQNDLENSFGGFRAPESRTYTPHLTLGRIRQWEFRAIEPEERSEVNEEISLNFSVNSVEVMESKLKPTGPDYFILESIELGK